MGLWDKVKQTGGDLLKDQAILKKIHAGEPLTEEEEIFYNAKHPDISIAEEWENFQDKQRLKTHKRIVLNGKVIFQDEEGFYYFSKSPTHDGSRFYLIAFEWNGATYETISNTKTTGKDKKQGRMGSVLVGGVIAGPIGALAGASRKKNTKVNRQSTTTSKSKEKPTKALLVFLDRDTHQKEVVSIMCDTKLAEQIYSLNFVSENTVYEIDSNTSTAAETSSFDQLKELKELLDLDIITQEEFDIKKKELLDL